MAFSEKQSLYNQVQKDLKQANDDEDEDEEEEEYEDQYEEEEDDDDGDFDANELLNLTDYQNKRGKPLTTPTPAAATSAVNKMTQGAAIEIDNEYDDEEEENDDADGWGDDWGAPKKTAATKIDSNFDYANTNLNKLTQEEIAAHKKNMDQKFLKNQLKPGDAGFQYDKRIDFTKK